jgi:hypothetical protein
VADVLTKIEQIARMADLRCQRRGELLFFGFDMGGGRTQTLAIGHMGEGDDGMNVIVFFSPCQSISSGLLGGLSKSSAVGLLKNNATLPFGHFAIMQLGEQDMVCVRATQLLETMEVKEFEALCYSVAQIADAWEQKIGQDKF